MSYPNYTLLSIQQSSIFVILILDFLFFYKRNCIYHSCTRERHCFNWLGIMYHLLVILYSFIISCIVAQDVTLTSKLEILELLQ